MHRKIGHLTNEMVEIYSTATVADDGGRANRLDPELTDIMATSRDYERLEWAWQGWRDATGPRMKRLYEQLVDRMNEAAADNGNHGNTRASVATATADAEERSHRTVPFSSSANLPTGYIFYLPEFLFF